MLFEVSLYVKGGMAILMANSDESDELLTEVVQEEV